MARDPTPQSNGGRRQQFTVLLGNRRLWCLTV
jgi:hypothetical protein